MRYFVQALVVLVLGITSIASVAAAHLTTYPEIDRASARPVVVVASVAPGGFLPTPEECKMPAGFCLHSPLWFRASVSQTLFGVSPGKDLEVATTSHYGMSSYEDVAAPRLLLLLIDRDKIVMPTYSQAELSRRDDGELFLPTPFVNNPFWLPCSISTLREEISPRRFPELEGIPKQAFESTSVKAHPELFVIIHGKAYPRFGIRLSKLRSHLERMRPNVEAFECKQRH